MSTPTPTAPSRAVAEALARLEREFPLVRAVVQYELAAEQAAQLAGLAESGRMSDLNADSLAAAEAVKSAAYAQLDKAGRLDLIGVDR
jgi:hypothetical protein